MMKDKITDVLTTKKTVFGFHVADLLGIVLMIIPCLISLGPHGSSFSTTAPRIAFLPGWIPFNRQEVEVHVTPDIPRALVVVAFYYGALIARYGIFKKDNLLEALISSVRTFLNCWGLAALLGIVLTTNSNETFSLGIFSINTASLLLFAVLFSWFGMKTLAGYVWIIFVLAGMKHFNMVSDAMGGWGAACILTLAISMLLQVNDFSNIQNFMGDFRNATEKHILDVKEDISSAANDASVRAQETARVVKEKITDK